VPIEEATALRLDAENDPALRRDDFHLLPGTHSPHIAYLAGNSLGLQPKATRTELLEDLQAWQELAVHGHTEAARQWFPYHELLSESAAKIVGAKPSEVVMMNSLTVNLHLMFVTFYQPTATRNLLVIEDHAFSSDSYAARSHVAFHGLDPDTTVLRLRPRAGEMTLRTSDIIDTLREHGDRIATIMLGGVNYLTGEVLDIPQITKAGHEVGAMVGWDLAHAAGNIPLHLHDWDVDFAAWCSYKYLNSGPGAVAGAFVHERHFNTDRPRFEGWWTNQPNTRFAMQPVCDPQQSADAWALSNPPIFALGPVRTSLNMFDDVGMATLRKRSLALSSFLLECLDSIAHETAITVITPRDDDARGTQVSVRVPADAAAVVNHMHQEFDVVADERPPDIIRFAPVPMYCTFHDCWRAVHALRQTLAAGIGI